MDWTKVFSLIIDFSVPITTAIIGAAVTLKKMRNERDANNQAQEDRIFDRLVNHLEGELVECRRQKLRLEQRIEELQDGED